MMCSVRKRSGEPSQTVLLSRALGDVRVFQGNGLVGCYQLLCHVVVVVDRLACTVVAGVLWQRLCGATPCGRGWGWSGWSGALRVLPVVIQLTSAQPVRLRRCLLCRRLVHRLLAQCQSTPRRGSVQAEARCSRAQLLPPLHHPRAHPLEVSQHELLGLVSPCVERTTSYLWWRA
jgi:hypothetical protein